MAMKKADWQRLANSCGVKFQKDDSIATLAMCIAVKKGITVKGGLKGKALIRFVEKELPSGGGSKGKSSSTKGVSTVGITYEKVVYDTDRRPDICLCVKGENMWFPKKHITLNKKKKVASMPKWLADLKIK